MLRIPCDKDGQLLDGGDDDAGVLVFQLAGQHPDGVVPVRRSLLESVIFLDGLEIQVLSVNDKKHLVHIGKPGGKPGGLEGSERLARPRGVPDVAAGGECSGLFVVVGYLDALKDAFRGGYLIGTQDPQELFRGKDTEAGKDIQQVCREKKVLVKSTRSGMILLLPSAQNEVNSKELLVFLLLRLPLLLCSLMWASRVVLE